MRTNMNYVLSGIAAMVAGLGIVVSTAASQNPAGNLRIEISFPAATRQQPVTGRAFVVISRHQDPEPRLQAGDDNSLVFGIDVEQLKPREVAVVDSSTLGYPVGSLRDIPAGDYYVQGLLNVYTEFHRADGHTIWAHLDQWEGQQFNVSPGNICSPAQKVRLDANQGYSLRLSLTQVIPPLEAPADTSWVRHIRFQSRLLTEFWGRPMFLGATILLPRGYDEHSGEYYPVVYEQGHFNLGAPLGFKTEEAPEKEADRLERGRLGIENGYEFFRVWDSANFPRVMIVEFLHPTPFYDDSYAVNSANNGPYGDAILTEMIPYLEAHFRIIRKPYARVLAGGSTGGWEALALQLQHPDFFGGAWVFCPDPVDFRRYILTNIYDDDNAFWEANREWVGAERPLARSSEGQVETTMRQFSQLDGVLGTRGRSGQQLAAWEAAYGPVDENGYPKPLWDRRTGTIDHNVAHYMRDHGYDLRDYAERNWPTIGQLLVGKLHFYCGDMDNFYLNLSVYLFEDFLKKTTRPYYGGSFTYGRALKGHGWNPMTNSELIRTMAQYMTQNAGVGERAGAWSH